MSIEKEMILEKDNQEPIISLIIMGFIVFSPFSSILVMDILGFPFSMPEILIIPFLFHLRNKYFFSPVGLIRSVTFISLWVIMIIISFLVHRYPIQAILGSSRPYLTLIIAYLFFSRENNFSLDAIMYISLGSTLGWLFSSIYGLDIYLEGNSDTISRGGNMLAIPLLISIAIFHKHNKTLLFSLLLCVTISLTSGMRRQIAVFLISLFLSNMLLSLKKVKQFMNLSLKIILVFIILYTILTPIERYVKVNAPQLYYRVFQKTEMFLTGNNKKSGDSVRINNMNEFLKNYKYFITPKGFVSRHTVADNTGSFIDFPLSELFYTFGFTTIFLLLIIGLYTAGCFYHYLRCGSDSIVFVIIAIIMMMFLFLEGTFLSSTYITPFTGYCLGRLKYYSRMTFFKGIIFQNK